MDDSILRRIHQTRWNYADYDPAGCAELERRLAATARERGLITYSDLVRGITFNFPNVRDSPLQLGVPDWTELHRTILGDLLGRISCNTYEKGEFLISSVAVRRGTSEPGEGFLELARELGLFTGTGTSAAFLAFWANQVRKTQDWYAGHA